MTESWAKVSYRISALRRRLHNFACRGILNTPPLAIKEAPLAFCSMVSGRDFVMYLSAMKSIYQTIGEGKIVVIDDGTLSNEQRDVLRQHLAAEIRHIKAIPQRRVPQGGCWERLMTVIELCQTHYVIQIDSDTITRSTIPEVLEAYRQNRPFILAGDDGGVKIVPVGEIAAKLEHDPSSHQQIVAERQLNRIPGGNPLYVRGCAGFFGMPKGKATFEEVERFSDAMTAVLRERWQEWGSEQVTVNYLIANLPGALVLQPPKYASHFGQPLSRESHFIHFMGTYRFDRWVYTRETRDIISKLKSAPSQSTT